MFSLYPDQKSGRFIALINQMRIGISAEVAIQLFVLFDDNQNGCLVSWRRPGPFRGPNRGQHGGRVTPWKNLCSSFAPVRTANA